MRARAIAIVVAATSAIAMQAAAPASAGGATGSILAPGARLSAGHALHSAGGRYTLQMQPDGNLVLLSRRTPTWSSQTDGHGGASAVMRRGGELAVVKRGKRLYTSGTAGSRGAALVLRDDGNAVVRSRRGGVLWSSRRDRSGMRPSQLLRPGQYRRSPGGRFQLTMQVDGNLVLYRLRDAHPLWSSQTHGHGGARAVMRRSGELVVLSRGGRPLYTTATGGRRGARLAVRRGGNVVVRTRRGRVAWSSNVDRYRLSPGQVLTAGQWRDSPDGRYRLQMQFDGNLVLVALPATTPLWATMTISPGAWATMQPDGNLVVYSSAKQPLWQTGTLSAGAVLDVQTDGNVVVYARDGTPLWSRLTHG